MSTKAGGVSAFNDQFGLAPEWLAGASAQAWRADTVRSWPAENAARYTVPLFTAEQVRRAVAAERERLIADGWRQCAQGQRTSQFCEQAEALRAALAGLVQVYVIDGAATTPAREIGDAWKAAQRALLRA